MDFASRIVELRKSHSLTQKELANRANLSEIGIRNYEGRRRLPSCESLVNLSKYFKVSTDYLLGLSDNPQIAR